MRDFPADAELLKVFETQPDKTFRLRELLSRLGLRSSQARGLKHALNRLKGNGKILYLKNNLFTLAAAGARHGSKSHAGDARKIQPASAAHSGGHARGGSSLVTGRLVGHRDGYGFVE
jgi:hypothetical protein